MTISGLTESGLSGRIISPKNDISGFAGRAARPSGGLFRFWAVILLNPNQFGIPHPLRREVKRLRLGPLPERPPSTPLLSGGELLNLSGKPVRDGLPLLNPLPLGLADFLDTFPLSVEQGFQYIDTGSLGRQLRDGAPGFL